MDKHMHHFGQVMYKHSKEMLSVFIDNNQMAQGLFQSKLWGESQAEIQGRGRVQGWRSSRKSDQGEKDMTGLSSDKL